MNGVSRGAYRYDGLNRLAVREERNSVPARLTHVLHDGAHG